MKGLIELFERQFDLVIKMRLHDAHDHDTGGFRSVNGLTVLPTAATPDRLF